MALNKIKFPSTILGLDYGTVVKSIGLILVFFLPVAYVHELGHAMACDIGGGRPLVAFSVSSQITYCGGSISDPFFYLVAGGSLAALVSFLPLLFWFRIPAYVKIVSLTFGIGQAINAYVESMMYHSYISDAVWQVRFAQIAVILILALLFIFARPRK